MKGVGGVGPNLRRGIPNTDLEPLMSSRDVQELAVVQINPVRRTVIETPPPNTPPSVGRRYLEVIERGGALAGSVRLSEVCSAGWRCWRRVSPCTRRVEEVTKALGSERRGVDMAA